MGSHIAVVYTKCDELKWLRMGGSLIILPFMDVARIEYQMATIFFHTFFFRFRNDTYIDFFGVN